MEENEELKLCHGVLVHVVDSLLSLLPIVNVGVNWNNEV